MAAREIVTLTLNPSVDLVLEAIGLRPGAHVRARRVAELPSGKGVNVSVSLALLGVRSTAMGILGRAERPMYERHFATLRPARPTPAFTLADHRTRTTVTLLDPLSGRDTHLREPGPRVTGACRREVARAVARRVARGARTGRPILAVCGSAPPGFGAAGVAGIVRRATRAGALVAIDLSAETLRAAAGARPWLIKVNAEEIESLTGVRVTSARSAAKAARAALGASGARAVAVTLGAKGAVLALADQPDALHASCAVAQSRVRSTVGCGDAFLAGMLSVLRERPDAFERALLRAVACAGAAALDARTGVLSATEAERLERAAVVRAV